MPIVRMSDLDLRGKRVLIREDLNVPIKDGKVTSEQRIAAALPTLVSALDQGAAVMVMSHLGRPTEGRFSEADSLQPVAERLSHHLGREVRLVRDWLSGDFSVAPGEIVLLENCRMNMGEGKDDETLSKKYAELCDVFVMDAFGTAHRAQASTHGVIRFAPVAAGGPLLMAELDALARALETPARPLLAIVAGSKVSTKLELLGSLVSKVDQLIVGGGIANTFLAALGHPVGKSLYEPDLVGTGISAPRAFASRMICLAVSTSSISTNDLPTSKPSAAMKVLAMPPPTISWSTLPTSDDSSSSLVLTLLPATIASSGRAGLSSALPSASSSAISSGPPQAVLANLITPWVDAWARCAVPNASMTNTSHNAAYRFDRASSSVFSPTFMRQFSNSTSWPGCTSTPSR